MTPLGRFDTELEMFIEPVAELSVTTLLFWRYLVTSGKLDDDING